MSLVRNMCIVGSLVLASAAAAAAQGDLRAYCSNYIAVLQDAGFPKEAVALGLEAGVAVVGFTLNPDGSKSDLQVLRSTHEVFAKHGLGAVPRLECSKPIEATQLVLPMSFRQR